MPTDSSQKRTQSKKNRAKKKKAISKGALATESEVRIVVAKAWIEDLRYLENLYRDDSRPTLGHDQGRTSEPHFDVNALHDSIDIIVGGSNLSAGISGEFILPFFIQLCKKINHLAAGAPKTIVEFLKEPWDLVMVKKGTQLYLSVMSVDSKMQILSLDIGVDFLIFSNAIRREARCLLDVFEGVDSLSKHRDINELRYLIEEGEIQPQLFSTVNAPPPQGHSTLGVSYPGFNLSFVFKATPSFLNYRAAIAFDLHALLIPGGLNFEFADQSFSLGQYLFITFNALIRECETLIQRYLDRRSFDLKIQRASFSFHIKNESGTMWELAVGESNNQTQYFKVDGRHLLESIFSLALGFAEKLEDQHPEIALNQRFIDFHHLAQEAKQWWDEASEEDVYNDNPEHFLEHFLSSEEDKALSLPPTFPFDFSNLRALYPKHQWTFSAKKILFDQIFPFEDDLIVPTDERIFRLCRDNGNQQWSVERQRESLFFPMKKIFLEQSQGQLYQRNLSTGTQALCVSESRKLFTASPYPSKNIILFTSEEGALCRDEGLKELWTYDLKGRQIRGSVASALFLLLDDRGSLHALNPENGECLWKIRQKGKTSHPPLVHQSRVFLGMQGDTQFDISCRLLFTGRQSWIFSGEGTLGRSLFFHKDLCIFSVEKEGLVELWALCLRKKEILWKVPFEISLGNLFNAIVYEQDVGEARLFVKSNSAELICIFLSSGRVAWRVVPEFPFASAKLSNLIILRDAILSCNERFEIRALAEGNLISHVGDTMIETDFFQVFDALNIITGENNSEFCQPDQLVSFTIKNFLAMVDLS